MTVSLIFIGSALIGGFIGAFLGYIVSTMPGEPTKRTSLTGWIKRTGLSERMCYNGLAKRQVF